jgi:hypothetical protein
MNNITPKQKEYIEIDEDFKCYTGRSKRLIPLVKHFKFEYLESLTDELSSFSFLKLNFGIYTLNYIKKIEENLPIFNEIIENDIKDRGYPKEKIETIKRVQSDLIIEINNAKSKAEKTSNKSSKKKPIPKFEEVINKKLNWNKKQIETLENELKRNFADIISKSYNKKGRGSKELLYFAILHLGKKEIIDFEAIEAKKFLRFFVNLFLGENYNWENFEDKDYIGFTQKLKEFKNNKNDTNTKKYREQIKPVFEKIEEKHTFIKIAGISIN